MALGKNEEQYESVPLQDRGQTPDNMEQKPTSSSSSTHASESPPEWQDYKTKWWWMSILIFMEISLIATIVVLERISTTRNGIATVPHIDTNTTSRFSVSNIWKYGLLWTTLPSLVMVVYRIVWESIVNGSADRQPFVELARSAEKASNAKLTIMLDYRSISAYKTWLVAIRNGHIILGLAMILSLIISIAVVPLTAHLFVSASSSTNTTTSLSTSSAYNDTAFGALSNLQPAFDLATAIRTYDTTPPTYMTPEYAFVPLDTQNLTTGNVTIHTNAYSAYLDCQEISPTSQGYSAVYSGVADGLVTLRFQDRGCQISNQVIAVSNSTPKYATSWYSPCSGLEYNRIGVIMGEYSSSSPINLDPFTVISCIPSYWLTSGPLTISVGQQNGKTGSSFVGFATSNSSSARPFLYQVLESTMHTYSIFDPSNTYRSDAFGFYVYSYALKLNSTNPFAPAVLISAVEDFFTTVYASLANTMLFSPSASEEVPAVLSTTSTRLFVVTPVAWVIVAVLALALVCNILLLHYAQFHRSILTEEPVGLLGHAVLTEGSGLDDFVRNFRTRHQGVREVSKYVAENYTVKESRCFNEKGRVRVEGLNEKSSYA